MAQHATTEPFFEKAIKLLAVAVAVGDTNDGGATDNERFSALNRLRAVFQKHGFHPSQLRIELVDHDGGDAKSASRRLRSRLQELERQHAFLKAENARLERLRAMAATDAQRELEELQKKHRASIAAARAAQEAAETRAITYRRVLADRVARSKKSRMMPLNETALDRWQDLERAGAGFGRRFGAAVAAICGISRRDVLRYSELREPLPVKVVEAVKRYVAENGNKLPNCVSQKRRTVTVDAVAQPAINTGMLGVEEVALLRECRLQPSVLHSRLKDALRAPTNLDRQLALILSEGYGLDAKDVGLLLGLSAAEGLLMEKRNWIKRLSTLVKVSTSKLLAMLRAREVPKDWMTLLPQAVAS